MGGLGDWLLMGVFLVVCLVHMVFIWMIKCGAVWLFGRFSVCCRAFCCCCLVAGLVASISLAGQSASYLLVDCIY